MSKSFERREAPTDKKVITRTKFQGYQAGNSKLNLTSK